MDKLEEALKEFWSSQMKEMMVQICGSDQKEMMEKLCMKRIPTAFGDVWVKQSWLDKHIKVN